MSIRRTRAAKLGLSLSRIFKKILRTNPDSYWPHGTHGTSGTRINLRVRIHGTVVHTCQPTALPIPALSSVITDSQPAALHVRLHQIAPLRTAHAHGVSIANLQEGRAGKARNQSLSMRAAWGHANARAREQRISARRGNASPGPIGASSAMPSAESRHRRHQCQPANAAHMP